MSGDNVNRDRRSTRLSIAIPIVVSGVDAEGNRFSESVRTLIVNKHGGKIATTHPLAMGTEVLIENRVLGVVAKASVVWLDAPHHPGDMHHVALQLLEAQNVWGVAFPPDDWQSQPRGEAPPVPDDLPASPHAGAGDAETPVSSLAAEEITVRLLQELQKSADAHLGEFQDRLKLLTQRLGLEFEINLRDRAAGTKAREVGAVEEEIKVLQENLRDAKEKMGKLEASMQELKRGHEAATGNPSLPPTPLQEARRQLAALANSVIESMNRAAEAGLREYRSLLQKENQQSAARLRPGTAEPPTPPGGRSPES
jgi:hypothetical protein